MWLHCSVPRGMRGINALLELRAYYDDLRVETSRRSQRAADRVPRRTTAALRDDDKASGAKTISRGLIPASYTAISLESRPVLPGRTVRFRLCSVVNVNGFSVFKKKEKSRRFWNVEDPRSKRTRVLRLRLVTRIVSKYYVLSSSPPCGAIKKLRRTSSSLDRPVLIFILYERVDE